MTPRFYMIYEAHGGLWTGDYSDDACTLLRRCDDMPLESRAHVRDRRRSHVAVGWLDLATDVEYLQLFGSDPKVAAMRVLSPAEQGV